MNRNIYKDLSIPISIMVKMPKSNILLGIAMGGISMASFGGYLTKKVESYESRLLRGTAEYIRQYEGETPRQALDFVSRTLEITRQFQPEQIGALEIEVFEINSQIGETSSPRIYKPVLVGISERIEDASEKRDNGIGGLFMVGAVSSLLSLSLLLGPTLYGQARKGFE